MKLAERFQRVNLPRSSMCKLTRPQNSDMGSCVALKNIDKEVVPKQELQEQTFSLFCQQGELEKALSGLFQLEAAPSRHIYTLLLKLCHKRNSLVYAQCVLVHLVIHQWDLVHLLGDLIVFVLAKCGGVEDALHLINNLPCHTVFAWTTVVACYVQYDQSVEALRMLSCMLMNGVEPDRYTFVSLLKACSSMKDIAHGRKLHTYVQEKGLTPDLYVGSTLVSMYGKCGKTLEAEWVFCELSGRNIVTWNAMLSAYLEQGQGRKALLLCRQLLETGESPSESTYISVLQACNFLASIEEHSTADALVTRSATYEICQAFHAAIRKNKFDSQVNLGNTLVSVYGKLGFLSEAENTFLCISQRDVVSWNALLSAYVDQDQGAEGLRAYAQMQSEGVSPDQHTFAIFLQACCILAANDEAILAEMEATSLVSLKIGQSLHADIERMDFFSDSFIVSTLVCLYGKCGLVKEAEDLFLKVAEHDVVSWTSMLSAFVEQGYGDMALQAYRQMQEEGVNPDEGTMIVVLQACGVIMDVKESEVWSSDTASNACKDVCRAVHAEAQRKQMLGMSFLNTLIAMYGKCDMFVEAELLFSGLLQRNIITWNALLSVYVEHSQIEKALLLYKLLSEENVSPDELTYLLLLQACSILAEREEVIVEGQSIKNTAFSIGQVLHNDAQKKGFTSNNLISNSLLNIYSTCGGLSEALEVFNSLSQRGVVAWNALMSGFLLQGQGDVALQLYEQMQSSHTAVNKVTLVRALQACCERSNLELCRQIHFCIAALGYEWSFEVAHTLIHTYGGCRLMDDAWSVFGGIYEAQVVSWNACLSTDVCEGNCLRYLEEMLFTGMYPNEVTFLSLLSACSHSGNVWEGVYLFIGMRDSFNILANKNHDAVMIDLFGRAGDFKCLECFMQKFSMQLEFSAYLRLLAACRTHNNVELGKWAFDQAVSLCPESATSYVCMSNIYAASAVKESIAEAGSFVEKGTAWGLDNPVLVKAGGFCCMSSANTHLDSHEKCLYNLSSECTKNKRGTCFEPLQQFSY